MRLAQKVASAIECLAANDPTEALDQICASVEVTAKREGRARGNKGYKAFIRDNIPVICGIGFASPIAGLRIAYQHSDLPRSADGCAAIEDIVYHCFRCGLYHATDIPDTIEFTDNTIGPGPGGKLLLPRMLVAGIVLAVVASPANAKERTTTRRNFQIDGEVFDIDTSWGQKVAILQRLSAIDARRRAAP